MPENYFCGLRRASDPAASGSAIASNLRWFKRAIRFSAAPLCAFFPGARLRQRTANPAGHLARGKGKPRTNWTQLNPRAHRSLLAG